MSRKEKRYLTTGDIARYCGVNFRTVIRWIKKGHLKAHQLPGRGDNRVTQEDFLDFLKSFNMAIPEEYLKEEVQNNKKILVVENELPMAKAIERALYQEDYEIRIALDGFQAGTLLPLYNPDLMTLDLSMPGISGLDVLKFVRGTAELKNIKILIISARSQTELNEALDAGADAVLQKPFENEELLKIVSDLLK